MAARGLVLEGFAGPGGWSTGLRMAGFTGTAVGVELDRDACRTAVAAGHLRIQADVATYPLAHLAGKVAGCILSPPCPSWSTAGDGAGKVDLPNVLRLIDDYAVGREPGAYEWADGRSHLTAEPMRYTVALRPRWIALEQVPPVLPIWRYLAAQLRSLGYWAWCGILSAEEYGVAQTRKRAILVASLDGPVGPPAPTHQAYVAGRDLQVEPDLFGDPLPPPVSMAQALGWHDPCIALRNNTQSNSSTRGLDEPAGTMFFGQRGNAVDWVLRSNYGTGGDPQDRGERTADEPAPTVTGKVGRNLWMRNDRGEAQFEQDSVRVTVQEAGILQSFPADYPWQGTKTAQYRQVGDAVPPLLTAAILRPLVRG